VCVVSLSLVRARLIATFSYKVSSIQKGFFQIKFKGLFMPA